MFDWERLARGGGAWSSAWSSACVSSGVAALSSEGTDALVVVVVVVLEFVWVESGDEEEGRAEDERGFSGEDSLSGKREGN